ncbi:MAG TPA: polysaccharide biosynthesis tyrosine autokinase [Kiritimatiellia bacterium]|nr:polysaccharide biosynthesis tyrosine autokinase [Kiritimatiellia bacterium]
MNMPSNQQGGGNGGPVPHPPYYIDPTQGRMKRNSDEVNLLNVFRVLRKKRRTIAIAVAAGFVLGVLHILTARREYRAETLVEFSVRRPRILGQQSAVIDDSSYYNEPEEVYNTRLERFKGRVILDRTLERVRQMTNAPAWPDDELRRALGKHVNFSLIRRSRLMRITYEDANPVYAAAVANAFAEAAVAMAIEENRHDSDGAVAWLQSQSVAQRGLLEKADTAVVTFRATNMMDIMETQRKGLDETLIDFNKALASVESQRVLAEDVERALMMLELKPEAAGNLPASTPRADEIQAILTKWMDAVSERDVLLTKYTEKHPEVVAKEAVITALHNQTMDSIRRARDTAKANLMLLRQQSESLQKRIRDQEQQATGLELEIVEKRAKLNSLEMERQAADISYKGILNRIEEARLSADEHTATVKIVEPATPPEKPYTPHKSALMLVWLILGAASGVGLAFVTELLEDSITSTEDIEKGLGLKVFALVPHVEHGEREDIGKACMTDRFSQMAEAYAGLRGLLDSSQYRQSARSVLVGSTAPEEGKTITACNLAIMCARSGLKTLLIDFDLRRPRLGRVFNMPPDGASLLHVLAAQDEAAFGKLPYKSECDRLDVVVSRVDHNLSPAEVIGGKTVKSFLAWATKNYDRVIVDSPPFSVVSDSFVLADYVGAVLLVCRPDHTRKRALQHAVEHLLTVKAALLGVVVNDVHFGGSFYFRSFDHYYSHYNYRRYFDEVPASKSGDQPG